MAKEVKFKRVVRETDEKFEWLDLSSEEFRTYTYPDGNTITVARPVALSLTKIGGAPKFGGGSHRIVDLWGYSHYIPRGWLLLTWRSSPFFEF